MSDHAEMTKNEPDALAFPFARSGPFDPPAEYALLRASRPATRVSLPDGTSAWLVTRYDDVRSVLTDPRFSSQLDSPAGTGGPGAFLRMDPPRHDQLRRMLAREFSTRRIEAMRPGIQEVVDCLIDGVLSRSTPVDLMQAFAYPLPSMVICELLGVPYEDHDFFQGLTRVMADKRRSDRAKAVEDLRCYLDRLIAAKSEQPGDDLISRLIVQQVRVHALSKAELAGMAALLLAAGFETTASMIGLGMLALLEHPQRVDSLRGDPALVANAVEELLRYLTIFDHLRRAAVEDIEMGDVFIRRGDEVLCCLASANWDERVFATPGTLDLHRYARHNLAFGAGIHVCLGAPLARVELQVAFSSLVTRIPSLHLAMPPDEVPLTCDMMNLTPQSLPVAW